MLGTPRPHEPSHHNDKQIREALGNGRCVVLTGEHLDGPSSMSKEDILAWRGSLQHKIECLGEEDIFFHAVPVSLIT